MKTFRLIYLSLAVLLLSACQAEIWEPAGENILNPGLNPEALTLSIFNDDVTSLNATQTKAGPIGTPSDDPELNAILSKINDLNIKVNLTKGDPVFIYCDSQSNNIQVSQTDPGKTAYIDNCSVKSFDTNKNVKLHLDKVIASNVDSVQVIANAGKYLKSETAWNSCKETGPYDPAKGYCLMYGVNNKLDENTSHSPKCKNISVELKRSRAIVSVVLKDNGMKTGLTIEPKVIRFHNMAQECTIVNLRPDVGNKILDSKDPAYVKGYSEERAMNLGLIGPKANSQLGQHADVKPIREEYLFFPLENAQGEEQGNGTATTHPVKYPEGVNSVADAKDPAKNYKCTYLEIEADYFLREGTTVKYSGKIVYRFFLGANEFNDFNVLGNKYYKVNLGLKDLAGLTEDGMVSGDVIDVNSTADLSWRVDANLQNWGFTKSQYDFDCHLVDGTVDVIGDSWSFLRVSPKPSQGNESFLVLEIGKDRWINPAPGMSSTQLNIVNGKLRFNVQPMVYGSGSIEPGGFYDEKSYLQEKNYREIKITIQKAHSVDTQQVVIRQYVPIPVFKANSSETKNNLIGFMERFEEYPENPKTGLPDIGYQWKWEKDKLNNGRYNPSTMGFDYNYNFNEMSGPIETAKNTIILSPKHDVNGVHDADGEGSAAHACMAKGNVGFQGAMVYTYCLPSTEYLRAMFAKSNQQAPNWGPFEPLHVYEDYWTQSTKVPTGNPPYESIYYRGSDQKYVYGSRLDKKRVRAIFIPSAELTPPSDD